MIAGIFHAGSGTGNQLHRYVATRVLALDKGLSFAMVAPDLCKVKDFMDLEMESPFPDTPQGRVLKVENGKPYGVDGVTGKVTSYFDFPLWEEKTPYYNPEFNFIEDDTLIDGEFQDERYFEHRLGKIDEWLKVEPIDIPDDVCVIGFRGGEFYVFPELGLPKSYFEEGVTKMKGVNPNMKFEVHTDDEVLAKQFFPDFKIIHDVGINWRSMRFARYAIIANSSFYIFPRLLKHNKDCKYDDGSPKYCEKCPSLTMAPHYWDRYNIKKWERPYNYYKVFRYI